jgi:hypothetical protein
MAKLSFHEKRYIGKSGESIKFPTARVLFVQVSWQFIESVLVMPVARHLEKDLTFWRFCEHHELDHE